MMKHLLLAAPLAGLCVCSTAMGGGILAGTVWEDVAQAAPCTPDPLLLYSIALLESRIAAGGDAIRPHPFALRNVSGSVYPTTLEEAESTLRRFISEDRLTDIGVMQINYRWNGNRVDDPAQLLDLRTNIKVGAEVLCEALTSQPHNLALAIGGYHTRNPSRKDDAIRYGEKVLHIWSQLEKAR